MRGFILFSLLFLLSFCAIAESPPGLSQTVKLEMKSVPGIPDVAPTVAVLDIQPFADIANSPVMASLDYGNLFCTCAEPKPTQLPASLHGDTGRSCKASCDANTITKSKSTTTVAKAPTNIKADFKVGWQG